MKVQLYKLETRIDALTPQEHKYPPNTIIAEGYMYDYTIPTIGNQFFLYGDKLDPFFQTSVVVDVVKNEDGYYIKTLNSKYQILINE